MTIEELMELSAAELKAKADELEIEYGARVTKAELSELIYEKTNNQKESADVAEADEGDSQYDVLSLENGATIVPHQFVKVQVKQGDGTVIEGETSLDDLLSSKIEYSIDHVENLEHENANLKKEIEGLKAENAELEKLAYREVIGHPSQDEETKNKPSLEWNGELELMNVRVRVLPNSGVLNRMRHGLSFTNQYRSLEVDKETFDALIADSYLQVEALEKSESSDE